MCGCVQVYRGEVCVDGLDELARRRCGVAWYVFFFQAEDGIRDAQESRGLGDVYKRQPLSEASGQGDDNGI